MGLNWAEHTVEIDGSDRDLLRRDHRLRDLSRPGRAPWSTPRCSTGTRQGRGKRVRLFVDAKVRKVDYTLDYRYDEPTRIEWDFVEGNGINDADGHYLFEDLGG